MYEWKKKLHDATSSLVSAVGHLHSVSTSTRSAPAVVHLVNALVEIIDIQEKVNSSQEEALKKHNAWRFQIEDRLQTLEESIRSGRAQAMNSSPSASEHVSRKAVQISDTHSILQYNQTTDSESKQDNKRVPLPIKTQEVRALPGQPAQGVTSDSTEHISSALRTKSRPKEETSKENSEKKTSSTSELKPECKANPRPLPSLPTLAAVYEDLQTRRQQKRRKVESKPPPCDKCRLRKRALMHRQHGYIKEDVFEIWAAKPGACFEFLHMDEQLLDNYERHAFSFEETGTQSPEDS